MSVFQINIVNEVQITYFMLGIRVKWFRFEYDTLHFELTLEYFSAIL